MYKKIERLALFFSFLALMLGIGLNTHSVYADNYSSSPLSLNSDINSLVEPKTYKLKASQKPKAKPKLVEKKVEQKPKKRTYKPEFVSSKPDSHIVPPDEDPQVRINPEAPGPFKAMAAAYQSGDVKLATRYADQYVRYMVNLMFQVRQLTQMIGEALVRNGVLEEDSWVGVEQYMMKEFADARKKEDASIKVTHDLALQRIKSDPKGQAEVLVFCTLSSVFCREMAPDIERLRIATKNDKNVKLKFLVVEPNPERDWLESFSEYTGLNLPIHDGREIAKKLRIGFVPSVLIISPGNKTSYLKTGKQDFVRLYEFLRTVQGKSKELTPELKQLIKYPIGEVELIEWRVENNGELPEDIYETNFRESVKQELKSF